MHRGAEEQGQEGQWRRTGLRGYAPRRTRGRGRPRSVHLFDSTTQRPVLTRDELERRAQREQRFTSPGGGAEVSGRDLSSRIWRDIAKAERVEREAMEKKPLRQAIGVARAVGLSRVPNAALAESRPLMESKLDDLLAKSKQLEDEGLALVSIDEGRAAAVSKHEVMQAWESILGEFRQLTMAITATPLQGVQTLGARIYEGAADASLLGGDMSFYLKCQSKLVSDMYTDNAVDSHCSGRRDEFVGYSLLYFGVFSVDNRELATIMRRMSPKMYKSHFVVFGMEALAAYAHQDATKFLSLFKTGTVRQKTILSSSIEPMETLAMKTLVRSYLKLEKSVATSRLGMISDSDFLQLLAVVRPDLAARNAVEATEFHFRRQ